MKDSNDAGTIDVLTHLTLIAEERDKRYAQRFDGQEKANTIALVAQEKAVAAALQAAERAVLKAEVANEAGFASVRDKLDQLATRFERGEGKSSGISAGWGILIGVVGIAGAVTAIAVAMSK